MSYIINKTYQALLITSDNAGTGFAEPELAGVKVDDLLIMMWNINDDDVLSIDDAGWTEIPGTNANVGTHEVRAYYKFATVDNEQCSTWSNTYTGSIFFHTFCVRGVNKTTPFADSAFTSFTSGSNTIVRYPALTATADNQLALYISGSDADDLVYADHAAIGVRLIAAGRESGCYSRVVNTGAVSSFEDSIASDQSTALGFIFNDSAISPVPLNILPIKSLAKITPDTNNNSGWMEAVYASGADIDTGLARVSPSIKLTIYSGTTYSFRMDGGSGAPIIGDTVTFGDASTGILERHNPTTGNNQYLTVSQMTGGTQTDNSTVSFSSGATRKIKSTGSYQIDITGLFMGEEGIADYTLFKSSGYSAIGLTDGNVYWIKDIGAANSFNEGYAYEITAHASRYDAGTTVTGTAGSITGSMIPYSMCNFSYNVDADNDYPTGSTGITGWKKSMAGSCRGFTTSADWSGKKLGLWHKTPSLNVAYVYFLIIDTSNNWKMWRIRSKYIPNYIYTEVKHNIIQIDSVDTPWLQTSSFNSNAIKYYGMMIRESSDAARNGLYTYDVYEVLNQAVTGGGNGIQVSWADIAITLNSEINENGITYDKSIQSIVPSQYVISRSLTLSCEMGMRNQALSFPPQADGKQNFLFNVDGGSAGIETDDASGNINTSLIASDKGAFLTNTALDTIDYTGSIISKYIPTLQSGKTYLQVSFVDCAQITGRATLSNCTITNHTGNGGVLFDGLISGGVYKDNTYAIEIDVAGDYTLNDITFSNNTKDINITATTGTVNITTNVSGITYITAGATVNILAPTTTLTITGITDNTEVRVYKVSDGTELIGVENSSGGSYTDDCSYVGDVQVVAHHIDYVYVSFIYTLTGSDVSIPIQQQFDSTYKNS
jgi:hypothetical protein